MKPALVAFVLLLPLCARLAADESVPVAPGWNWLAHTAKNRVDTGIVREIDSDCVLWRDSDGRLRKSARNEMAYILLYPPVNRSAAIGYTRRLSQARGTADRILLVNSDAISGELVSLRRGVLVVKPDPKTTLTIPTVRIRAIVMKDSTSTR